MMYILIWNGDGNINCVIMQSSHCWCVCDVYMCDAWWCIHTVTVCGMSSHSPSTHVISDDYLDDVTVFILHERVSIVSAQSSHTHHSIIPRVDLIIDCWMMLTWMMGVWCEGRMCSHAIIRCEMQHINDGCGISCMCVDEWQMRISMKSNNDR